MKHKLISALDSLWLLLSPVTAFFGFLITYEVVSHILGLFLEKTNLFKIFIPLFVSIYVLLKIFKLITGIGFGKEKKEDTKYYPPLCGPLSVYDETLYEFQVDSTLINIDIEALGEEESIRRGNEDFDTFWGMSDEALVVAEKASRIEYPLLWDKHDEENIKENPLEMWSIHYDATTRHVLYDFYNSNSYPAGKNVPLFPERELLVRVCYEKDKGLYAL